MTSYLLSDAEMEEPKIWHMRLRVNTLPNNTILHQSKLKTTPDERLNLAVINRFVSGRLESIV